MIHWRPLFIFSGFIKASLMHSIRLGLVVALGFLATCAHAEDWPRFRGNGGNGISESDVPVNWSASENLKWKRALPGPGASSPIVIGDRIFVTCYTGEGNQSLERHLLCINRADGEVVWKKTVAAEEREDDYRGFLTEHGYASNTPVSDGEHVYAFFGKSGVFAFDAEGEQLWQTAVGTESSNRRWGSGASLILHGNLVIVNSSEESQSIRALNRKTGKEVWKSQASSLELTYGTPTLISLDDDRTDLLVGVPGETWGLNADTGKLRWYCLTDLGGNVSPSVVSDGQSLFVFGGRPAASHGIRTGGKGDVTDSHMIWSSRNSSYVATPLLHDGKLFWVDDRGVAFCADARSGEALYRERLDGIGSGGRPVYASPVMAGGQIYVASRWDGTFVLSASAEFKQLARNPIAGDKTDFNATPAISDGELFLRSNQALYCVTAE